ncbi:murein DD-endopeptidase MepM [bacterium BMS3Bbin04]|nr:murein DD-endopeptidase MepM [bacterium BMS3Bbin04]
MDSSDGESSIAGRVNPEDLTWTASKLLRGETLSTLLGRMDVPDSLHYAIIQAIATQIDPRRMPAGAKIELGWSLGGLLRVDFSHPARDGVIQTTSVGNNQYVAEYVIIPADTILSYYDGIVSTSVYETLLENGGTPQLAVLFFEVFQFTHYFAVDTRRGDRFSFVVEEIWREGVRTGYGSILAARYSGEFDTLTAVLKTDGMGTGEHFDDEGFTFRRDLLRVPFPAARITSTYGVRRHPVTGQTRMHHGVDLAADRGTPVVAAGRGVVTIAARNDPGYGNWVHIKHGDSGFETRYGHFQKIAQGIHEGVHVEQGDVIGYVGSTGQTTGPHLHYEVFRDGKRMNPLKVKGSPVQRIEGDELAAFIETTYRPWTYLLDSGESGWELDVAASFGPMPVLLSSAFASKKAMGYGR